MKHFLSAIAISLLASLPASALPGVLYGNVSATDGSPGGICQIGTSDGGALTIKCETEGYNFGGFFTGDLYWAQKFQSWGTPNFMPYSTETWTATESWSIDGKYPYPRYMTSDYATEPGTGAVYGCGYTSSRDANVLCTYSYDGYDIDCTEIGNMSQQLGAMAFDADGRLYGIAADGTLYEVDKSTGGLTAIGNTGIQASTMVANNETTVLRSSGVIDDDGLMYWSVAGADGIYSLYKVNTATAAAEKLRDFASGTEVKGIFLMIPEALPGAPDKATELTATFAPGSLSGTFSFKAPQQSYDGNPISGNLPYRVLVNGEEKASGTTYTGVERVVELSVPAVGMYTFEVICSNGVGDGAPARLEAAIGYAQPAAPEVSISIGWGVEVSWTEVSTDRDGNPLTAPVSYRVVRNPGSVVVQENTTYLEYTDYNVPSNVVARYNYEVYAICNGTPSEPGESESFVYGAMEPPYHEDFEGDLVSCYTVLDVNGDGYTWNHYGDEMYAQSTSDRDADDWLFSVPVKLGWYSFYPFSIEAKVGSSQYPGKIEVFWGTEPTPEAMTNELIPATVIDHENYRAYSAIIGESRGETIYIGVHNITEADMWWTYVDNLRVGAAVAGTVPSSVADFTATPDIDGAAVVELALKAPAKDIQNNDLSGVLTVEFYRDGTLIHTEENVLPGADVSYTDRDMETGTKYEYMAVASNSSGKGSEARVSAFVGINLPATPLTLNATYVEGDLFSITLSWDAVTTYIDGTPLNPANVKYNIWVVGTYMGDMKVLADLTETTVTFQAMLDVEDDPQTFFQFAVTAETSAGENMEGAMTEKVPLGHPETLPYRDSFANLTGAYNYGIGSNSIHAYWDYASDKTFEEVKTHDGDNGMLAMYAQNIGEEAWIYSGRIDLGAAVNPMLTFYVYKYDDGETPNTNTVEVEINTGAGFETVNTYVVGELGEEGWHRIAVPLTDYAGMLVQFRLTAKVGSYLYTHIDNINVRDRLDNDIELVACTAPERIKAGQAPEIAVSYANFGLNDAADFTIELYADGEKIDERAVSLLASDFYGATTFSPEHTVASPENIEYAVKLNWAADADKTNNDSETFTVVTIYPNYPVITDLKARYPEEDNKDITLTWSAPDLSGAFEDEIIETFEDAIPWADNVDNWTFIDADGQEIYGFTRFDLPEWAPQPNSRQSWWVMDTRYEPLQEAFSDPVKFYGAHSGSQYIASMAVWDSANEQYKRSDDWAISPELCGAAQTVSLWAKSFLPDADADESFEFLYSTAGTEIADFTLLRTVNKVPGAWTQYFFDVPSGARYFAIRCISRDCYILMIDDVAYTPAGDAADLEIAGYNIYRDGIRINTELVTANVYNDRLSDDGTHVYTVTTVFLNRGESMFSNEAIPELSGLGEIAAAAVGIRAEAGEIVITGAVGCEIAVVAVDGRVITRAEGSGNDRIAVVPGVYIVRAGNTVAKIAVR